MDEPWVIEIEPEVRRWLCTLSDRDYLQAEHAAERLSAAPTTLGEPFARHLGDGLRELRFILGHDGNAIRLTYWLAPGRRIVLLTVFRKTRMREDGEVDRARSARKTCEAEHERAHQEFTRDITKGEFS
ncbi:type II toxin-antitoxin system RelE/ParE family toxin [Embleya sp. NPDC005971]|uniref:type II toxin-antitoxin system RelE/ParE family toxin n=1 Tax=unclassified Embleya TaxID=2699296 RepID=UPI0033E1D605